MSEKEIKFLSDRDVIPTDEHIFSILGSGKELWQHVIKATMDKYPGAAGDWNYYNDGKQWLYKMVFKKKTLFWARLEDDTFRTTFYFADRAEPLIAASELPLSIKEDFKTAKKYGAIRPVTFRVCEHSDVQNVIKLLEIKNKIK
jgi:hypothetical protein